MNAHVLLNLLNKFGKRDKMRCMPSVKDLGKTPRLVSHPG